MALAALEAVPGDGRTRTSLNPPTDHDIRDRTMLLGRTTEVEALAGLLGQARAGGERGARHSGRSRYRKDRFAQ